MNIGEPAKRRLNPLSFPPETNVRFGLLILAVCMLGISIAQPLRIAARLALTVVQGVPISEAMAPTELENPAEEPSLASDALAGVGERLGRLAITASILGVIFLLATALYRAHPARILGRNKLSPLQEGQHATLDRRIRELSTLTGISPPAIMLGEGLRSQSGQAFGVGKKIMLGLGGGVRLLLVKAPAKFRAIILHELAHVANRDIWPTYFSEALWRAILLVVVFPLIVMLIGLSLISGIGALFSGKISDLVILIVGLAVGIPVLIMIFGLPLLVVAFIRAGLLRAREFYADSRAAQWGAEKELLDILRSGAKKESFKAKFGLRFHPTARQRIEVLEDPRGLFRTTADLVIVIGLLLGFVLTGLLSTLFTAFGVMLSLLLAWITDLFDLAMASSDFFLTRLADLALSAIGFAQIGLFLLLVFGLCYLVAATIGLQVQREAVASLAQGQSGFTWMLRLAGLAVLMAISLEIGALIAPPYLFSPLGALIGGLVDPLRLLLVIPWLIGFATFTWLGFLYARFSARLVLGAHVSISPPRWKRRLLTFVQSALLCLLYSPLLAARVLILFPSTELDQPILVFSIVSLLAALFLYPGAFFATWSIVWLLMRGRPTECPTCGQLTLGRRIIPEACRECQRPLAIWLFASPAA